MVRRRHRLCLQIYLLCISAVPLTSTLLYDVRMQLKVITGLGGVILVGLNETEVFKDDLVPLHVLFEEERSQELVKVT